MKKVLLALLFPFALLAQSGGLVNATRGFPQPEDTATGVVQYGTAIINASGNAIAANTGNTSVKTYIVLSPTSTAAGNATLAAQGSLAPCKMDSTIASGAGNYFVINSTTTNGDCHAQASLPASGVYVIGYLQASYTTTGVAALVEVNGFFAGIGISGTPHAFVIAEGSGAPNYPTPPTTVGDTYCFYHLTISGAADPACYLSGLGGRALTGSSNTDLVLFSDNSTEIDHDVLASASVNESLPTATTLVNPSFHYEYCNFSAYSDQITPVTWTINGSAYQNVPANTCYHVKIDPNSANNWIANCSGACGGSSGGAYSVLTDGATVSWPVTGASSSATVTLGGNRTLSITGLTNGWSGKLLVKQDGTGSRTLALPAGSLVENNGAGVVSLTSAANAIDKLTATYDGTNLYWDVFNNYTAATSHVFAVVQKVATNSSSCSGTTCTITVASTGSGHLLVLAGVGDSTGSAHSFSSASGGGSWVHCTACTNGGLFFGSTYSSNDIAYVLSSSSGATSITWTWNGSMTSSGLLFEELSYSGSTITYDTAGNGGLLAACSSCSGVALSPAGSQEVIIQYGNPLNSITGISGGTYGNLIIDSNFSDSFATQLNSANGTAPAWSTSSSGTFWPIAIAFKGN